MVRLEELTKRRSLHCFLEMKLRVALCQFVSDQTTVRMCYELLQLVAILYVCCVGNSTRVDCYISPRPCPRSASGERQDRYHRKITQGPRFSCYARTTSRKSPYLSAVRRDLPHRFTALHGVFRNGTGYDVCSRLRDSEWNEKPAPLIGRKEGKAWKDASYKLSKIRWIFTRQA